MIFLNSERWIEVLRPQSRQCKVFSSLVLPRWSTCSCGHVASSRPPCCSLWVTVTQPILARGARHTGVRTGLAEVYARRDASVCAPGDPLIWIYHLLGLPPSSETIREPWTVGTPCDMVDAATCLARFLTWIPFAFYTANGLRHPSSPPWGQVSSWWDFKLCGF